MGSEIQNRRVYRFNPPDVIDLIEFVGSGGASDGSVQLKVPAPDARALVVVDLQAVPPAGGADPMVDTLGGNVTVWASERQYDQARGLAIPTANVVGTRDAPLAIPVDTGTWGYRIVYKGEGPELFVVLTANEADGDPPRDANPPEGTRWVARVTYCAVEPMTEEEWARVTSRRPTVVGTSTGEPILRVAAGA